MKKNKDIPKAIRRITTDVDKCGDLKRRVNFLITKKAKQLIPICTPHCLFAY
jgi:hypothetical protein